MIQENEVIRIGTLTRTHGRRGEVQCRMENTHWDQAEAEWLILMEDGIRVPYRVEDWRGKGTDSLIFQLRGIDSEEAALRLCGKEAYMLRREMVDREEEDEMQWSDFAGWVVIDEQMRQVGQIAHVDDQTANILFILEDNRILPAHEDLIIAMDEERRWVQMRTLFAD